MPEQGRPRYRHLPGGRKVEIDPFTGEPIVEAPAGQGAAPAAVADAVLTVREAAEMCQVPACKVYKELRDGRMPGRRIGGTWRLSRRGLLAWLGQVDTSDE